MNNVTNLVDVKKRKSIYEANFDRLEKLGILNCLEKNNSAKSESSGFMDLCLERIGDNDNAPNEENSYTISLAHYYKANGDLCADPDMEILIIPSKRSAHALAFQMPNYYQVVYPRKGYVNRSQLKEQNSFLRQWLINLKNQGHNLNSN
jgi:uncharacterized protein YqiB (DUF1249 family)